jgi:hypothetical protein
MKDSELLEKIEKYLIQEVYDGAEVLGAKDAKDEQVTSDGTENIIYGRAECASGLLNQMAKWKGGE